MDGLMNTDEYEISLSREITVCEGYVRKYQMLIHSLEERYGMTTSEFLERMRRGTLPSSACFAQWNMGAQALQYWTETLREYQGFLESMKVSAS